MKEALKLSNQESNKITKESIQISLMKLLEDKDINEINITEIVKKAGVSRTAFYRNYKTKEDVILELCSTIIIFIKESSLKAKYDKDSYQFFYDIISKIKEEPKTFKVLLTTNLSKETNKKLEGFLYELFEHNQTTEFKYLILAYIKGLRTILDKWIDNGMEESVEEISHICNNFCKSAISTKKDL